MNDKISSLLSMVKNEKYRAGSNKKSEDNPPSPSNYVEKSPKAGQIRDKKKERTPNYQEEQYTPQRNYEVPHGEGKYLERSHRMKTTNAIL